MEATPLPMVTLVRLAQFWNARPRCAGDAIGDSYVRQGWQSKNSLQSPSGWWTLLVGIVRLDRLAAEPENSYSRQWLVTLLPIITLVNGQYSKLVVPRRADHAVGNRHVRQACVVVECVRTECW